MLFRSEPRLERASLTGTRALLALQRSGGEDSSLARYFDSGIAIVDSLLRRTPRDPVALAARGRLTLQRAFLALRDSSEIRRGMAAARNDHEMAFSLDTPLAGAAADLSQILFESEARFEDAASLAERAYRLDSYMEESSQIINRLALSNLEIGRDAVAAEWCREGQQRFPANPAHWGCALDVMAWGEGRADADSGWAAHREARRLTSPRNVSALASYDLAMVAVLARIPGIPADSARHVLTRAYATIASTGSDAATLRDGLLTREAAALYRLGDSATADTLVARIWKVTPSRAATLVQRRMLRSYVKSPAAHPR